MESPVLLLRVCLVLALYAIGLNGAPPARAGFWLVESEGSAPDNSIRLMVPCPFGSPADSLARTLARTLSGGLGRTVHVVNFPPGMAEWASADSNTIFLLSPDANLAAACGD